MNSRRVMTAFTEDAARRRMACGTDAQAQFGTPEQRYAEMLDAQEFHRIKEFVAACRRQWPGARIVLRPDHDAASAPADARADNLTPETERRFKWIRDGMKTIC
jgi:hypothetical protein